MLAGGIRQFADARVENLLQLRLNKIKNPLTLLRLPGLSLVAEVVEAADTSINSELEVIKALSRRALQNGKVHQVILMIDVGDLREGIFPEQAIPLVKKALDHKGAYIQGIGTNMGCFGGVLPTQKNLGLLQELGQNIRARAGIELPVISGGGTSSLLLVENKAMPPEINQLRIGEGILLGTDTTNSRRIPYLHQDAFTLKAEVIEIAEKPSLPMGEIGRDAFGRKPSFVDRGTRRRAILALGKQDVEITGLSPEDSQMLILGGSSDHLVVDITDSAEQVKIGSIINFFVTYPALLSATTSPYINKHYKHQDLLEGVQVQ
jgi:predicted amino acid racemase